MANDKDFKIKNGLQVGGAYIEKVGTITGNADVDLSTGNVFDYTPTANATFTFSNAGATEHSFVLSVTGDEVAAGYDLANASYDSVSLDLSSETTIPEGLFFKPDGTKMYVIGIFSAGVFEYNLSTAWDLSTSSYVQNFSTSSQGFIVRDIFFKGDDGTKMYVCGDANVFEYSLSTAWDISTAAYVRTFSVSSQDSSAHGLFFKPDGTKLYIVGSSNDSVYEYNLSTAWDISTSLYSQSFSVSTQETQPEGLFFTPTGETMFVVGVSTDQVREYDLSTAWDISTASYVRGYNVTIQANTPKGLFFGAYGTKMYIVNDSSQGDAVFQYSTAGTPAPATFTYPASVKFPSGTAPAAPADGETDILEFSTTDGGTTWYGVRTGDAMA